MITPLPAGTTFAGFQLDGVLARGGMGVVYLATQLRPRRRVALKLIAPQYASDPGYRQRFLREVDALAALEHPHIVPIHAAGEWDGQLYLAMRYLDGPDLASIVRDEGPLEVKRVLRLLAPIADALDTAHALGIVHRDVTPGNIRLDRRGDPYLTDFGLTRRAASQGGLTLASGPIGTPAYMAPEEFVTGDRPADPALTGRIDVYALGCVMCTCLTGSPPFPRDTYEAALWAHVHEPPPRLSERRPALPPALDGVLATALAKDPAQRHPTAGSLVAAMAAAAGIAPRRAAATVDTLPNSPTVPLAAAAAAASPGQAAPPAMVAASAGPGDRPYRALRRRPRRSRLPLAAALALLVIGAATMAGLASGTLGGKFGGTAAGPSQTPRATPRPTPAPTPTPRPTPAPTPTPSPTPEPTPTPVPTPTPTPEPVFGSKKDVTRLTALVPASIRKSCESAPISQRGAIAALRCQADDVDRVDYVLYEDAAARDAAWQRQLDSLGLDGSGDCSVGQPQAGSWSSDGFFGMGRETLGKIACWVDNSGNARLDWTLDSAPVRHGIRRSDGYLGGLYRTWSAGGLTVRARPN